MRFFWYLLGGVFITLIQSSKIFKTIGLSVVPDFVLVYLLFLALYSSLPVWFLVYLSIILGFLVDSISSNFGINWIAYTVSVVLFIAIKTKFFSFNVILKVAMFVVINTVYILTKNILQYGYSGYFTLFTYADMYNIFNNLFVFYFFYLLRAYVYEKSSENK